MKQNQLKSNQLRYAIVCKTDPYHAARLRGFSREGTHIEETGLTLKEAYKSLLEWFNHYSEHYAPNWGAAVLISRNKSEGANPTFRDGTRSFTYDIYTYEIIENLTDV